MSETQLHDSSLTRTKELRHSQKQSTVTTTPRESDKKQQKNNDLNQIEIKEKINFKGVKLNYIIDGVLNSQPNDNIINNEK